MTAPTRPPNRPSTPRPKQPRRYVDAAPVRERLEYLAANDLGLTQVAKLTGIHRTQLQTIVKHVGRRKTVTRLDARNAAKILAVQPRLADLADGAYIDATGSYRRMRALVALGFPATFLAGRLGFNRALRNTYEPPTLIRVNDARAIRELYEQLSMHTPAEFPELHPRFTTRAANRARALGWPLPLEWDDNEIDDPGAQPRRSRRPAAEHGPRGYAVTDGELEDLDWILRTTDVDPGTRDGRELIGQRLGVTEHRVEYMLGKLKARQRIGVAA